MLLLKYANKKDRIGSRTGSLSCLFLLSRGDVVNGTKLLKQRIKALVEIRYNKFRKIEKRTKEDMVCNPLVE